MFLCLYSGMFLRHVVDDTELIISNKEATRSDELTVLISRYLSKQMHYAAGRFNEGVNSLFASVKNQMKPSRSASLNSALDGIVEYIEINTPPPGSRALDPSVLFSGCPQRPSNDLWRSRLDSLLGTSVLTVSAAVGTGSLATVLGTPIFFALPATATLSVAAMVFSRWRYQSACAEYFDSLSSWHKAVKNHLMVCASVSNQ